MIHHVVTVFAVSAFVGTQISRAYNISPVPNVIFTEPHNQQNSTKIRSSYFGLSLVLKPNSIFIGAPRSQSTLRKHASIVEGGAIYRCDIRTGRCDQFADLDGGGFESGTIKSGQYLGASMDGLTEGDELVGCAPRLIKGDDERHAMTGACYSKINDTVHNQMQAFIYQNYELAFDTALEGFAVHMLRQETDGIEIVTGMPNCNFTGSIMFYEGDLRLGVYLNTENLTKNGYFGYSVNSMRVQATTIYLVSAPRVNDQPSKVFLFEKYVTSQWIAEMKLHRVISGDDAKIDYFGYAICTEDINGDGLSDVLIGAPFHSEDFVSDNGVVFVYLNLGLDADGILNLEEPTKLSSDYVGSGQFGYSIAATGDINADGYNDIAIGAPFDGDGAVYIFHGSPNGLQRKPGQILKPSDSQSFSPMFGASISKGLDVDNNAYNDIAIGAPAEDKVYLFKTYPIVRSLVNATFSKAFIVVSDNTATSDSVEDEVILEISSPITVQLNYEILNQNVTSKQFCDHCVMEAEESKQTNQMEKRIIFRPDCERDVCATNLQLRVSYANFESPFVLNSSRSLELQYEIQNFGEAAYGTVLKIQFLQNITLLKHTDYEVTTNGVICLINRGQAVRVGFKYLINLVLDATRLEGELLESEARLLSEGNETVTDDNVILTAIELKRVSTIKALVSPYPPFVNLDEKKSTIKTKIVISNEGPSDLSQSLIYLLIPVGQRDTQETFMSLNNDNLQIIQNDENLYIDNYYRSDFQEANQTQFFIDTNNNATQPQFLLNKKGKLITCSERNIVCANFSFMIDTLQANGESICDLPQEVLITTVGSLVMYRTITVVPVWIYVAATVAGLTILALITYALYRQQFFTRMTTLDVNPSTTVNSTLLIDDWDKPGATVRVIRMTFLWANLKTSVCSS
ncbi:integrin alpha-PS4-like [Sabethes cyaneus]|uniref:integrin alpha-PS4-like n=1 Tax=Sabethes cyaneus TaxID=53552 RepID=UPI00237EB348|nr:integrin alpha-PS4-like [Sabethes cyaneus]